MTSYNESRNCVSGEEVIQLESKMKIKAYGSPYGLWDG